MPLKKTIASYRHEDGHWVPQLDIEMHPLEENAIKAHWAIHDVNMKIPPQPSMADEHEWMIQHGAEFVRQKRTEWEIARDTVRPELAEVHAKHDEANRIWNEHVKYCVDNGLDYDIHDKEKYSAITTG